MDALQADLHSAYPDISIHVIGINQFDQGADNSLMMAGRTLPWLQDVDANSDGQSDVWAAWNATWRDVMIVNGDGVRVSNYNVTANNLGTPANYQTLRGMILDAAFDDQRPWSNWHNPLDTNKDTFVTSIDALIGINSLIADGPRRLTKPTSPTTITEFYDVDHDGYMSSLDCLLVINYLLTINRRANRLPTGVVDSYFVDEDKSLTITDAAGVLHNDVDADADPLTASVVDMPQHGTLSLLAGGGFTYSPAANFNGQDTFRYAANDGQSASTPTTVTIAVNSINDAPQAVTESFSVEYGKAFTTTAANGVLANDTDIDGDVLTAAVANAPAHGTLALNANGAFTYTPQASYAGADSFRYTVADGHGGSSSALVSLQIQSANTFRVVANSDVGAAVGQIISPTALAGTAIYDFEQPALAADMQLAADDHYSGDLSAPVVLMEFLDIQCPPCGSYHPIIRQLEDQFGSNLLVVRRHLPLTSIHPNAFAAAVAAEAANRQGAYDEFIDLAYQNQSTWSLLASAAAKTAFESYATTLGLNLTQFRADVADPTTTARVQRDLNLANRMGLNSTPSFFLNGKRMTSAPSSVAGFGSLIQAALDQSTAAFRLDRRTGQLFVANRAAMNPSTNPSFDLQIRVRDTNGTNLVIPVHINVVNSN